MTADVSGLLLFDKPAGWTSHDVVAVVRRMLPKGTRVGHTGTLDPMATGLLVLLAGSCTRLQESLQGQDKVYEGQIRLGRTTDTGDVTGRLLEQREVPQLALPRLQAALDGFRGLFESAAPAYSAVKHRGRPLYEYARKGLEVPVKPRRCTVYEWTAFSYAQPELSHRLSCSSGTYVRSLAQALGERLGCGATVSALRRLSIGRFDLKDAITMDRLKTMDAPALARRLEEQRALHAA